MFLNVSLAGVTVLLEAPDADSVDAGAVGIEQFDRHVYPETAVKSSDPTTVGESWTVSPDPNIRRYGMCYDFFCSGD